MKKRIRSLILSSGERVRNQQLKRLAFLHHHKNDVKVAEQLGMSINTLRVHLFKLKREFNNFELVKNYVSGSPIFSPLGERLVIFYQSIKNVYEKYEIPFELELYEILSIFYIYRSGSLSKCERIHNWADSLAYKRIKKCEKILKSKIYVEGYFTNFGLKIYKCGWELYLLVLKLEKDIKEIKNKI